MFRCCKRKRSDTISHIEYNVETNGNHIILRNFHTSEILDSVIDNDIQLNARIKIFDLKNKIIGFCLYEYVYHAYKCKIYQIKSGKLKFLYVTDIYDCNKNGYSINHKTIVNIKLNKTIDASYPIIDINDDYIAFRFENELFFQNNNLFKRTLEPKKIFNIPGWKNTVRCMLYKNYMVLVSIGGDVRIYDLQMYKFIFDKKLSEYLGEHADYSQVDIATGYNEIYVICDNYRSCNLLTTYKPPYFLTPPPTTRGVRIGLRDDEMDQIINEMNHFLPVPKALRLIIITYFV